MESASNDKLGQGASTGTAEAQHRSSSVNSSYYGAPATGGYDHDSATTTAPMFHHPRHHNNDSSVAASSSAVAQHHEELNVAAADHISKSPSPPHSSATTSQTTTSPTSERGIERVEALMPHHQHQPLSQQQHPDNSTANNPGGNVDGQQQGLVPPHLQGMSYSNNVPYQQQQHQPHHHHLHQQQLHQASFGTQPLPPGPPPSQPASPPSQQQQQRYNPSDYPCAMKLLVSNNVAGSIIGRQGQTINELQSSSNTRIKLSQAGDFYPGTQDRVCLVQGDAEPVKTALRLLLGRLFRLQEQQQQQSSQHQTSQWPSPSNNNPNNNEASNATNSSSGTPPAVTIDFSARLLVPFSCSGMLIGKNGSNIKFMEDTTNVTSVRLSPKDSTATAERVVTITANNAAGNGLDQCVHCSCLIVDDMMNHAEVSRYTNLTTSYTRILESAAAAVAVQQHHHHHHGHMYAQQHQHMPSPSPSRPIVVSMPPSPSQGTMRHPEMPGVSMWDGLPPLRDSLEVNTNRGGQPVRRIASTPQLSSSVGPLDNHHATPSSHARSPLYSNGSGSLSNSNLQNLDGGNSPTMLRYMPHMPNSLVQPAAPSPLSGNLMYMIPSAPSQEEMTVAHSLSEPDLLALQLEQNMHITPGNREAGIPHMPGSPQLAPPMVHGPQPTSGYGLATQAPTMTGPGCFQAQVLVPDTMVGSILGRAGRTLNELQMLSGTRIRISQRGEYMPGTRSRIVSVQGPSAQSVWQAQYMMSQRMVLPPTATYIQQQQHQHAFPPLQESVSATDTTTVCPSNAPAGSDTSS